MNLVRAKTALLVIDVQNDFCPAYRGKTGKEYPPGALAVEGGGGIIPPLNRLAECLCRRGGMVLATQDWHPPGHVSFASAHGKKPGETVLLEVSPEAARSFKERFPRAEPPPKEITQVLWPDHCVQDSPGAAFHTDLDTGLFRRVFRKGQRRDLDSYSGFFENDRSTPTELGAFLEEQGIDTLVAGGLATDYCVFYTVMDALRLGFTVYVAEDACAGINIPQSSRAVETMKKEGAVFAASQDFCR